MSSRSPETLLSQLHKAPKILYKETRGDRMLRAINRLRVEVSNFLDNVVPDDQIEEINSIALLQSTSIMFDGIFVPTGERSGIELGNSVSRLYEFGVSLIGSREERRGKNGSMYIERQQWLLAYISHMGPEVWYAGPGAEYFTHIFDTEKIGKIEPLLQKLFHSGQKRWQVSQS